MENLTIHDIATNRSMRSKLRTFPYFLTAASCRETSATSEAVSSQIETMSNPCARRSAACAPDAQKIAAFFPAACVSLRTFAMPALCSALPNATFIDLARS